MSKTYPSSFFTPASLAAASLDYLLIAVFLRSRSETLPVVLEIAERAELFTQRDLESLKIYVAGFRADDEGATQTMQLIHYIRSWKGSHFYVRGRLMIGAMEQAYNLESVIRCFVESFSVDDYRAHCYRLIDNPYFPVAPQRMYEHIHPEFRHVTPLSERGIYQFPCAYMLDWFQAQRDHPASVRDQIQAAGISKGCDACPRFNPDEFVSNQAKEK
ncbi:hypothetical protein [Burkholderia gladioli]|uniref:hypothetical protein n=1 Tax=Burkholderia gladioli TaxID=28095 RepID=UPI00163E48D1|nr:hypothetical protein [Burkholderia gladioli]